VFVPAGTRPATRLNRNVMNIYIIAANVSIQLAKLSKNGLIANVGETTRNVRKRLKDGDYRRKTPGGGWKVIHEFVNVSVRDAQIHAFLKSHPRVKWNNNSNTEEFTFLDDDGSGSEAIKIVSSFLEKQDYGILKRSHSLLKQKYSNLLTEKERLSKLNQQLENSDIHKLIWEVHDEKKKADHAVSCLEEGLNRITHARKQFNQEVLRLTREKKQLKTEQQELISSVAMMEIALSEMELSKKRKSKFIYLLSVVLFGSLAYSFLSEEEVKKEIIYRPMVKYVEKVEQIPVAESPKPEKKAQVVKGSTPSPCQLEKLKSIGADLSRYDKLPQRAFDKLFPPNDDRCKLFRISGDIW